jgi:hypothetical protein
MRPSYLSPRLLAGLAAAAAIAALASCGDGGSSTPPKEFQAEANRVCRDLEGQLIRIQRTVPPTADQAEKQAAAVVDVSQQALDNLRQIEPPEDLKETYKRYLDAREKAIGFVEDSRDAAAHNDSRAYVRGKLRLAAGQPTRRQLALELGLSVCSRVSVKAGK